MNYLAQLESIWNAFIMASTELVVLYALVVLVIGCIVSLTLEDKE